MPCFRLMGTFAARRVLPAMTLLFAMLACTPKKEEAKLSQPILTRQEAVARAAAVSNITYDQEFTLDEDGDSFTGKVDIGFDWNQAKEPLKVDFFQGQIKSTRFNGKDVDLRYNGRQISVDTSLRGKGRQHLIVTFKHGFDPEANGLYKFTDSADKRVYLYSNLEPNFANVVFPCFDQPDLKATFHVKVRAPGDWVVVTNTLPERVDTEGSGEKIWSFQTSPKIATYVWALNAGPYAVIKDKQSPIPQRLLIRQSLADQVRPQEWFPVARAGLKFYGEFFGIPYPYKKLDLVLVPDFNWGGMENVAAITLTERDVTKGDHTREERIHIASLLLHEIAHMWFGDLVTMKWWDDLWLNESFASFMVGLAMPKAGFPADGWRDFYSDMKEWAYFTDDKVTTHPIESDVNDTSEANSEFDGITYGKGASVIKQLMYLIGEEKFKDGVHRYFEKHREGNAVLADFIGELAAASHRSLEKWSKEWLITSGLNTVQMDIACGDKNKITKARILQSAPKDHPLLREQAIQVALLRGTDHLEARSIYRAVFSGDSTDVKELIGQPCAPVVFPNYGDHGYAKFRFDPKSLEYLKTSLDKVKDPFLRQLAWSSMWMLVTDGEMSVKEFAQIWLRSVPHETDEQNLVQLFDYARSREPMTPSIIMYYPKDEDYLAWRRSADQMLWTELEKAKPGSDLQKHLMDGFISLAFQQESLQKLAAMLDGSLKLPRLDLDQQRRWEIVKRLAAENFDGALARIDDELKRDPSSIGEQEALTARVSVPSLAAKRQSLESITNEKSGWTFAQRKAAMSNLFPVEQIGLRNQFASLFFSNLEKFVGTDAKSDYFLEGYMELAPIQPAAPASSGKGHHVKTTAQEFLAKHSALPETVQRALKEMVEFGERYRKVLAKANAKTNDAQL